MRQGTADRSVCGSRHAGLIRAHGYPALPPASDNTLGPHGATAVGEALAGVMSLTSLDMGCPAPADPCAPLLPRAPQRHRASLAGR